MKLPKSICDLCGATVSTCNLKRHLGSKQCQLMARKQVKSITIPMKEILYAAKNRKL